MIKLRMTLAGGAVAFAMAIGTISVGTPALAYTNSISATGGTSRLIPADTGGTPQATAVPASFRLTRDLGPCWAQAGRLIGGFYGSLIASATNPWAAWAAWTAYLGSVSQEKRDKAGNFAC